MSEPYTDGIVASWTRERPLIVAESVWLLPLGRIAYVPLTPTVSKVTLVTKKIATVEEAL